MPAQPKISVTSKLDGIRSWSLQAIDTCPGSVASDGELVDACKGCYATAGNYRFPNVKAPRIHNREDWKKDDWVEAMIRLLAKDQYFRWFDSGDMYAIELARKILAVMQGTPNTKHWLPTRMHKFSKFAHILWTMQALPNVMVRASSDSVVGEFDRGIHGSVIVHDGRAPEGTALCEAYSRGGKCASCRACYDKSIPVIAYPAHGVKIAKVIKLMRA